MIYGIDNTTRNQYFAWDIIKEAGVEFCFLRMDTTRTKKPSFRIASAQAKAAGMVVGGALFADPTENDYTQAALCVAQAKDCNIDMLSICVEHWWADWRAYLDMLNIGVSPCTVKKLSSERISKNAQFLLEYCSDNLDIPVVIETGKWFVDVHSPSISRWISTYPLWVSSFASLQKIPITWSEVFDTVPPIGSTPYMPCGSTRFTFWQCSGDKIRARGVYADESKCKTSYINLNVFNGNEHEFDAFFNKTQSDIQDKLN